MINLIEMAYNQSHLLNARVIIAFIIVKRLERTAVSSVKTYLIVLI